MIIVSVYQRLETLGPSQHKLLPCNPLIALIYRGTAIAYVNGKASGC